MANELHLNIIKQGTGVWNEWRKKNPNIQPDLSEAVLDGLLLTNADLNTDYLFESQYPRANLFRANLSLANLTKIDLTNAHLFEANLSGANLKGAKLKWATVWSADITKGDLRNADLCDADLWEADLRGADLRGADLSYAHLVETNLTKANLTGCKIYGISAWGLKIDETEQTDLIITLPNEPTITVDNIEVAQLIYLLLYNKKIRHVIDTITSKIVLILGRFTPERKAVLDAIRAELRKNNYLPVLFDFEKPISRDITESISTLAHMALFIIADITDARSIPQELECIVPALPSVPVQPLLQASAGEYGMFEHFKKYPWVLPIYQYMELDDLLKSLREKVIAPAEARVKLEKR